MMRKYGLGNNKTYDKYGPNYGVRLTRMNRVVHMMPSAKFLFGAVYSKCGTIYSRNGQNYLLICQKVILEKIIDNRSQKYERPEIDNREPEFEITDLF